MDSTQKTVITVHVKVNAPIRKIWKYWTTPEHITQWNNASDDWHSPYAKNDLQVGKRFDYRMEAKDKSMGFDFTGVYTKISKHKLIEYTLDDDRKVSINFSKADNWTEVTESFEAETTNSNELQRAGWQAILDNFKKYTETHE